MQQQTVRAYRIKNEAETRAFALALADKLQAGDVLALIGELGTGKTALTRYIGEGLGIHQRISSPTFTIVKEYTDGRLPLYHFDVYRIGDVEEMDEIGYEDYFYGEGVCLIEWADLIREILPEQMCRVTIEKDLEKGFDYRKITLEGFKGIEEQEA